MSRQNKVNPGQYTQAGRLSPDDAAREQRKQGTGGNSDRSRARNAAGSGISNRESPQEEHEERQRLPPAQDRSRAANPTGGGDTQPSSGGGEQTSSKSGSRSGAQKAAESKYVERPHPASKKVEGAFGRKSKH